MLLCMDTLDRARHLCKGGEVRRERAWEDTRDVGCEVGWIRRVADAEQDSCSARLSHVSYGVVGDGSVVGPRVRWNQPRWVWDCRHRAYLLQSMPGHCFPYGPAVAYMGTVCNPALFGWCCSF